MISILSGSSFQDMAYCCAIDDTQSRGDKSNSSKLENVFQNVRFNFRELCLFTIFTLIKKHHKYFPIYTITQHCY